MSKRNFNGLGSLSGHASSMITSLKNNSRRKELNKYKERTSYKSIVTNKKATHKQLKQIREKLIKENRIRLLKRILFFCFLLIVLIYFLGFHKF
ncbi:MAG: hypothetical protein ACPGUU_00080 [Flavobacteriaceae bacterium]